MLVVCQHRIKVLIHPGSFGTLLLVCFLATLSCTELAIPVLTSNPGELRVTTVVPQPPLAPRVFWYSDLHDGTRADVASVLSNFGQQVLMTGHKREQSPYPQIFNMPGVKFPSRALAPVIDSHTQHSQPLSENDVKSLFEYYQNDPDMNETDAFICSFPTSFCEAYMPFNKTVIFLAAHRYALGRCTTESWNLLSAHLIQADRIAKSLSDHTAGFRPPYHVVAAMGQYDVEYINYFTGLRPILLSSFSWFYAGQNQTQFTQSQSEILVAPLQRGDNPFAESIQNAATKLGGDRDWTFVPVKQKYNPFTLQNIADHRAVLLLPYAVLSYGITELYAMGIPMFVPSVRFLVELNLVNDRRVTDVYYCPNLVGQVPARHPKSSHPYSPEDSSVEAQQYWLAFADYYRWPHITTFDSWDDLIVKLNNANFAEIHAAMMKENEKRERNLREAWQGVIRKIDKNRQIPISYEVALKDLWNTEELMKPSSS